MAEIHCHSCGGFIGNPEGIAFRQPSEATPPVAPRSGLCTCDQAVVYGPPPGYVSYPWLSSVSRSRVAGRN